MATETWLSLAKEILETDDDDYADMVLWEFTAFPFTSVQVVTEQLKEFKEKNKDKKE